MLPFAILETKSIAAEKRKGYGQTEKEGDCNWTFPMIHCWKQLQGRVVGEVGKGHLMGRLPQQWLQNMSSSLGFISNWL